MKTLLLLQAQQQERDLPAVGIAPREQQVPSTTHAPGAVLSQRGMNGRELAPAAGNGKGRGRELGVGGEAGRAGGCSWDWCPQSSDPRPGLPSRKANWADCRNSWAVLRPRARQEAEGAEQGDNFRFCRTCTESSRSLRTHCSAADGHRAIRIPLPR